MEKFHDDQEIQEFLEFIDEFSNSMIDQDQDIDWNEKVSCINNSIGNHEIVELKENFITKGLVRLERLFSKYDTTLFKPTIQSIEEKVLKS